MASKCTKCGNTDNYNFALNIELCDICISEKLEQQDERIKELEAVMQRCIDAMKGSNCLEEQWLNEALKG